MHGSKNVENVGKFTFFCGTVQFGRYIRFGGTSCLFDIRCTVIMHMCALRLYILICKHTATRDTELLLRS